METLPAIEAGTNKREKQDSDQATYARCLQTRRRVGLPSGSGSSGLLVRGFNSCPGASSVYAGTPFKVWEAVALDELCQKPAGTVVRATKEGIAVAAGERFC